MKVAVVAVDVGATAVAVAIVVAVVVVDMVAVVVATAGKTNPSASTARELHGEVIFAPLWAGAIPHLREVRLVQ